MLTVFAPASDEITLPARLIGGVHAYYRRALPLASHTARAADGGLVVQMTIQVIPYADAAFTLPWPVSGWPAPVTLSTDNTTAVDPANGNILFVYQGMGAILNTTTFAAEPMLPEQDWLAWLAARPEPLEIQTHYYRRQYDGGAFNMRAEEILHMQQAAAWGRLD